MPCGGQLARPFTNFLDMYGEGYRQLGKVMVRGWSYDSLLADHVVNTACYDQLVHLRTGI